MIALGWPLYLFRWAERVDPASPVAVADKIFLDLEELFLSSLARRVGAVIAANVSPGTTPSVALVRDAVEQELDDPLKRVAFARGQLAQTRLFARRRLMSLVVMWSAVVAIEVCAFSAFAVVRSSQALAVVLRQPILFWAGMVPAFLTTIITFLYSKRQNPLLLDARKALEGARDRIQD